MLSEFGLINRYFRNHPLHRKDVVLGIGDDGAVVNIPEGQQLVITMDTLVSGIHFLPSWSASDIAYKSLAVNLSDLAAMGAEPAWALMSLSMPEADEKWLDLFCEGFYKLAKKFDLQLIGGDISRGPLVITLTLHGFVPIGQAIKRSEAKPGDLIYVTGDLGEAGLALQMERNLLPKDTSILTSLKNPKPRIQEGLALRGIANSMIDISDGLAADLGHILEESRVGAIIDENKIPIAPSILKYHSPQDALELALYNGDDYELVFTMPPDLKQKSKNLFKAFSCGVHLIGTIDRNEGLRCKTSENRIIHLKMKGHQHFKDPNNEY